MKENQYVKGANPAARIRIKIRLPEKLGPNKIIENAEKIDGKGIQYEKMGLGKPVGLSR
ncbi:MAG: hypothetical protein K0B14_06445 [Anaerolineaceae bacterium]|nr:hypothetical protein [Anaerolineaceae bacterium]